MLDYEQTRALHYQGAHSHCPDLLKFHGHLELYFECGWAQLDSVQWLDADQNGIRG